MKLTTEQKQAIKKLKKVKVGALFMEPGTGKTLAMIKLVESVDSDFCLFIVPFQTKENLRDELSKWQFDLDYLIIGVESLSNSDILYLTLIDKLKQCCNPFIVVDESLKIKNIDAIRTQRVLNLGELAEYKLILNGTPLSRNLLDLYPQMQFLSPKILNMDLREYEETFIKYVRYEKHYRTKDGFQTVKQHEYISGYANVDYLVSLIEPFIFDAKLSLDVLKHHELLMYSVDKCFNKYLEYKDKFLQAIGCGDDKFLEYTQLMQQSYCIEPQKLELLKGIIKSNGSDNILVFCKFIKSKNYIEQNTNVKVMTYGKGAFGLNLQQYNTIVFWDKTFDYAQQEQAERRIYRVGQDDDCSYYHLTGDVGLEKMIDYNVSNKTSMLDAFKQAAAEGKGEEILNAL